MLRSLRGTRGRKYSKLRRTASEYRKRLIAQNRSHSEDAIPRIKVDPKLKEQMSPEYIRLLNEALKLPGGKQALRRYRSFTGLPFPTEIKVIEVPGPRSKKTVLVGMGKSPEVHLADGPKKGESRKRKVRGTRYAATDASGKRIYILSGKNSKADKQNLRFVGYAPETHYVLTPGEEKAGTFKRGKYWVHSHFDEGGTPPKVFVDQAGNFVYGRGSYSVGKWIRR